MGRPRETKPKGSDLQTFILGLLLFLLVPVILPILPLMVLIAADPPTSAYMLQSPTRPVAHDWVPAQRISPWMARAVIASEDQKFLHHWGFDLEAIREAWEDNQRGAGRRGASTLTQQTVKNLFLWPGGYLRKAIEAWISFWADLLWSKHRILELYLNLAEFGPGIYGVEAAAWHYFGHPAALLGPQQAAQLAAVLPNPRKMQVEPPSDYVSERAGWIQTQMQQMGPLPPALAWPTAEQAAASAAAAPAGLRR